METKGLIYKLNLANQGLNKTFEEAVSLCKGDYIAPCDQDDIWLADRLRKSYEAISRLPLELPCIVGGMSVDTDENKNPLWTENCHQEISDFYGFFPNFWCAGATQLFNRNLRDLAFPLKTNALYDFQLCAVGTIAAKRLVLPTVFRLQRHHGKNVTVTERTGFLGKIRYKIHKFLHPYTIRKRALVAFQEVVAAYGLSLTAEQKRFVDQLFDALEQSSVIFRVKQFSKGKRVLMFAVLIGHKIFKRGEKA
jgi:glycosyltransferase involved in cell wall biosynthesis